MNSEQELREEIGAFATALAAGLVEETDPAAVAAVLRMILLGARSPQARPRWLRWHLMRRRGK